jgi:ATP-binding cassette subfamily B protein
MYLVPLIPQVILDGVLVPNPEQSSAFVRKIVAFGGGQAFLRTHLWLAGIGMVILTALAGGFTYVRGRLAATAAEETVRRVRDRLYDHLQHLPIAFHDRAETGDLVQRSTSDVETLRQFLSSQVVEIGRAALMLLVPLPLMLALDWRLTLVSVAFIPIVLGFSFQFFRRVQRTFLKVDEAEAQMTSTLQENLTGIRVVRAFARQDFEQEKFAAKNMTHRGREMRLFELLSWYWSASDLLCLSQKVLLLAAGGYGLAIGQVQVGTFFFFLTAVNMFIWPIRMLGRILTELGKATVAIGRIDEILAQPVEAAPLALPASESAAPAVWQAAGEIVFEDVAFRHAPATTEAITRAKAEANASGKADAEADAGSATLAPAPHVLDRISFRVAPGETVALLGPSGAGKSTIAHLLLRFYDPITGVIHLDGRDLRTIDRQAVRAEIAVVMQEPFLFSKTVRENIRMGRGSAADEEIAEAASTACVHESIEAFEAGYDTLIGERGVTLSGGQRQRVALARALVRDPAIIILDDALSAVDTGTETLILDALRTRRGRHTTLVIAHRLSTLMVADRVLVIESGRLVAEGTHAELLQVPGLYQRLWQIQADLETELGSESGVEGAGAAGGIDPSAAADHQEWNHVATS